MALWLVGTAGATGVVFTAVSRLSTDLTSVSQDNNVPAAGGKGSATSTTVPSPTVTAARTPPIAVEATTIGTTSPPTVPTTELPTVETNPPDETTPKNGGTLVGPSRPTTATTPATRTTPAPVTDPPQTAPTVPPTVATTAPPPPPPTTAKPPDPTCVSDVRRVRPAGTFLYQQCGDGLHLQSVSSVSTSWGYVVLSYGPAISVRFTSTAGAVVQCTLEGDINGVSATGPC